MKDTTKIGIIICDRYHSCAGGKCFRALQEREGAFDIYDKDKDFKIIGYTSCGGCPGGNIEHASEEMKKNGVETVHLATGFVVGYSPCPHIDYFKRFIYEKFDIKVVVGTHPIPQKYFITHTNLGTWRSKGWNKLVKPTISDEKTRLAYD